MLKCEQSGSKDMIRRFIDIVSGGILKGNSGKFWKIPRKSECEKNLEQEKRKRRNTY